jgi:transposase
MRTTASERPTDWREGRRLRAWELHEQGWSGKTIAAALRVTTGAVSQWLKRGREGGRAALRKRPPPGPTLRLTAAQVAQLPPLLAKGRKPMASSAISAPPSAWRR